MTSAGPVDLPVGKELLALLKAEKRKMAVIDDLHTRARTMGIRTFLLDYDDLDRDPATNLADLAAFLLDGFPADCAVDAKRQRDATHASVKVHDQPREAYVRNWDDVKRTLVHTPLASLLKPKPNPKPPPQDAPAPNPAPTPAAPPPPPPPPPHVVTSALLRTLYTMGTPMGAGGGRR